MSLLLQNINVAKPKKVSYSNCVYLDTATLILH